MPYSIINPGERSVYRSFPNHVWVFREVASNGARRCMAGVAQAVVVPDSNGAEIQITDAPLLPWTVGNAHTPLRRPCGCVVQLGSLPQPDFCLLASFMVHS